jgi:hypothetical protein
LAAFSVKTLMKFGWPGAFPPLASTRLDQS